MGCLFEKWSRLYRLCLALASWTLSWRSWGALGTLLGRPWGVLRPSWDAFGRSWGALGTSWDALGGLLDASWGVLEASWEKYRKKVEGNFFFGPNLDSKMEAEITKKRIKKTMYFLKRFFTLRNWCFIVFRRVGNWKISISPRREHYFHKICIFRKYCKKC